MTTYELPPEPPIGESVQDIHGRTWKHEGVNRWRLKDSDYADDPEWRSWHRVLLSEPLTLIEPDPWPTAPLIVADWTSCGQQGGRGLLYRETDTDQYWTIRENESVYPEHTGDALTNVVPVTVVPTAEWGALVTARSFFEDGACTEHEVFSALRAAIKATDALGVDL